MTDHPMEQTQGSTTKYPPRLEVVIKELVGTLYARTDLIPTATGVLPEGFAVGLGGQLFELLRKHSNGQTFDSTGFQVDVQRINGAKQFLAECQELMLNPRRANTDQVTGWATELAEFGYSRVLGSSLKKLVKAVEERKQPLSVIIEAAMMELNAIGAGGTGVTWRNSNEIIDSTFNLMDRWASPNASVLDKGGVLTGFPSLDRVLGVIPNGEVLLVGARPSQGKTALVTQIGENVARFFMANNIPKQVAYFSAETSGEYLYLRLACGNVGVQQGDLKNNKATPEQRQQVQDYLETMRELPIFVDESPNPTTDNIRTRALALHNMVKQGKRHEVGLLIFDFAELAGDNDGQDEVERMSLVARRLKGVAKLLKCPVIVLCQVGRQVETRRDKMPTMADLRGSDTWGQVAYQIMFIHRPSHYKRSNPNYDPEKDPQLHDAIINLDKNKDGATGLVSFRFVRERARFYDPKDQYGGWDEVQAELRQQRPLTMAPPPKEVKETPATKPMQFSDQDPDPFADIEF
jgi:replicative DNA helicase